LDWVTIVSKGLILGHSQYRPR